jgi:hypothetical protein
MSNCVVRSRGSRLPCRIVADHGIEGGDHLSHDASRRDQQEAQSHYRRRAKPRPSPAAAAKA